MACVMIRYVSDVLRFADISISLLLLAADLSHSASPAHSLTDGANEIFGTSTCLAHVEYAASLPEEN